jgi:hypothetical protein
MRNKFVTSTLAQNKHADFLLKLSEKMWGIFLVGALATPAVFELTLCAFISYLLLLGITAINACFLHIAAIKLFNEIDKIHS